MNYLVSGTTYELVVGANTIDSLVENDPYGNIVPCAAESWESEDETVTLIVPAVKKLNDNGELELVSERTTEEANGQKRPTARSGLSTSVPASIGMMRTATRRIP